MDAKKKKFLTLFLSTFTLSACTFGGGFVIIPLMRKKFVDQLHWIEEQEMLDLAAIAQSAPGAIAVNASILVGYHVAGVPGALLTVTGTVLPPLLIISVISFFYAAFRSNPIVSMAMNGMMAGVAAVICDVVVTMGIPRAEDEAGPAHPGIARGLCRHTPIQRQYHPCDSLLRRPGRLGCCETGP